MFVSFLMLRKRGELRDDGFIFCGYVKNRYGRIVEKWQSPKVWDNAIAYKNSYRKKFPDKAKKQREGFKEKQRVCQKKYIQANPHKRREDGLIRSGRCEIVTGNRDKIKQFYLMRNRLNKCTGIKWHVDHVKPLAKGGLHHENNLQVITAKANLRKHDSFTP